MKRGEVAVENSVTALHEPKSGKVPARAVMVQSDSHSYYRQQSPQAPFQQSRPHLYAPPVPMPYQPQRFPIPQAYQAVQPLPVYQRYGASAAAMNRVGLYRTGTTNQVQHSYRQPPPPPPEKHNEMKRNMKQSVALPQMAPISLPVQLQASARVVEPRAQAKRQVCTRYARGNCAFGSSCKFFHDDDRPDAIPHSAPSISRSNQHEEPTFVSEGFGSNQEDVPNSLDESNFPSLPTEMSETDQETDQSGNQTIDHHLQTSLPKLVFRDAVLQQKHKSDAAQIPDRQGTAKVSTTSEEEPVGNDDMSTIAKKQVTASHEDDNERARIARMSLIDSRVEQFDRGTQDSSEGDRNKLGHKDFHAQRASIKPDRVIQQCSPQLVLPESGQHRYAIQPVYLASEREGPDDSAAFSGLSQDVNAFVRRVDSRLRVLVCLQQRALLKLQEAATRVWRDSAISVYGSNFTRLALPQSDVDCVMSLPSMTSEDPAELLRQLASEVRRHPWARRVELLDSAKIPVLKIVFCQSTKSKNEVKLDLTCAHSPGHSGLSARELIYSYQVEMPALRPLVLILKSHLQRLGLNSAYTGGISSYGLVLLVVRFLQACGDEHHLGDASKKPSGEAGRDFSKVTRLQLRSDVQPHAHSVYEFTRDGKLTWRTGIGNLLLLFLETYVTFDYRRFGITVEGTGQYFPLPSEKIYLEPGVVVSPYIVDPIQKARSVGKCFRMHEIIHAWYELYHQLVNGVVVDDAINTRGLPTRLA